MYKVTAHWRDTGREFHTTVEALSSQHAGALFVVDMAKRGHSVGIVSCDGTHRPLLSCETNPVEIVLDRIERV